MQKAKISRKIILIYSFCVALCSILISSGMFLSPSEPRNSVILGMSLSRFIIAVGILLVSLFFAALFLKAFKDQGWAEQFLERWFGGGPFSKSLAWFAGVSFGLGWIGYFLPSYRTGTLGGYWNRSEPIMIFILTISIATLAVFAVKRSNYSVQELKTFKDLRPVLILFMVSMLILGLMLYGNYGAYKLEDFWYGAGVPLLVSQLIAAIFMGLLFLLLKRSWNLKWFDAIVFILLYVITAFVWAREPLQKSFLFIGPYAPNGVLYPFADAATFDTASQFGLIGQGIFIFNTPFFERTLYLSFLIYLHSLFGQDYSILMAVQAAIFAILPSLIYLIGRSLNMRAVGFVSAIIAMFRGVNSILASNMIDAASPKMILTDFPTAIGIALIVLFACEWLKRPGQKWQYASWVGGAVGLTLMLRTNALVFLLFIPLYAVFSFLSKWRNWLIASVLMGFAVFAITLPWELRNVSRGGMLYGPIIMKIQNVIRTRYPLPSGSLSPQEKILSFATFQQTRAMSSLYGASQNIQVQACQSFVCFVPKHFAHNIITSVLILPTSLTLDDLRHTVKESNPFWRQDWDGSFPPLSLFFFTLNVFFIMLGIVVVWKRQRVSGLFPLMTFIFYSLSNAFARTSGGRYIVPVDWIISFYFVAGILFLITESATVVHLKLGAIFDPQVEESEVSSRQRAPFATTLLILVILFGAGSLVPLAEKLHAPRYANFNFTNALEEHQTQIATTGLTLSQIHTFLKIPGSELLVGRTLYPRWYKVGQGEIAFYPYTVMQFPRTGFVLIGPKGADAIVLPGGVQKYLPHATDALVIGCREQNYVDALAVVLLDRSQAVYTRSPMTELTCPLQQPVCTSNKACE